MNEDFEIRIEQKFNDIWKSISAIDKNLGVLTQKVEGGGVPGQAQICMVHAQNVSSMLEKFEELDRRDREREAERQQMKGAGKLAKIIFPAIWSFIGAILAIITAIFMKR